ncbi:MAG: 7,8-didemethyl-8-hydroxy-5-deazariboflavin synthase subunit CofH [Candidatus Hodarchaeota archaeon]
MTDSEGIDLSHTNSELRKILRRALNDEFPTTNDLSILFSAHGRDILLLGQVADIIRERQVGATITYVVNRNVNFTNVCSINCPFCAYSVSADSEKGYLDYSVDYLQKKIEETYPYRITEVCVQGGIHPAINFEIYLEILRNFKTIDPTLHIHAFSPQEVYHAALSSEIEIEEVLQEFKQHGIGSLPGTAAEILDDNLRRKICPKKIKTAKWVQIIKIAHNLGIPTTSTILFGHIEKPQHWIQHLSLIRQIQEETHGFTEFIPLPFIAKKTSLKKKYRTQIPKFSGLDYVKFYSVARLYLGDIIKNIQTSWVKLGFPLAQLTLTTGCNDFGGTLFEENITRSAGGEYGQVTTPEKFQSKILQLKRPFSERGTLYNLLS